MSEFFPARKLPRAREYPGYQFYCTMQKQNASAEECFCFGVLCVIDWLKQRLRETDVIPEEILKLPGQQSSFAINPSDLKSFTINSGFSAYVVSLPEHGIWSLRLKEPDSDTSQRKAVPGRFFTTNVGLHVMNNQQVELGIRIVVTDPDETPEVDFAFRPRFVRVLHAAQDITLTHATTELPYQKALIAENEEQLRPLRNLLESSECTMPVVLITQAIRLPQEKSNANPNRIPFPANMPVPPPVLFPTACLPIPILEQYYPFDADDIASHSFGHAITFRVSEQMHAQLVKRLKKDYTPGDVLLVEPKRFGRTIRILGKDGRDVMQQIWQYTHAFSKDRKYTFGGVVFEYDARSIESREQINQIRASGNLKTEEKLDKLNLKIDQLQAESDNKARKIDELREQLLSEYKRGEAAEKARNEQLYREYEEHEAELRTANARILHLEQENREARAIRSAVETLRSMQELPATNEEVVNYFLNVFGDRIAFTERGIKTACRCEIKPEGLWYYLYQMATALYDLHHAHRPDVESEFMAATGIEAAMGEGNQSRKDNKIMNLRKDVYEGKEVSMEPHVKLRAHKAGAEHQRIYYCYDHEFDRIIIGSVGEHLRTAGTIHVN